MAWVETADPAITLREQHILDIGPVLQAVWKAAWSSKSIRPDAEALFHRHSAHSDVLVDQLSWGLAVSEPRRPLKPVLHLAQFSSLDVHVIVGMVAHAMTHFHNLLQPRNIRLLEDASNHKEVHLPGSRSHPAGRAHAIFFAVLVKIAFLVIPLRLLPGGIVGAHLAIESD